MDLAYWAVRSYHTCWASARSYYRWLCSSTDTVFTSKWVILADAYSVEEVTRTRPGGSTETRRAICAPGRKSYEYADLFEPVQQPWLSIWCEHRDMTAQMAPYICKWNLVTPAFLESIEPNNWYIMDPKTFDHVKFPYGGILIR